MNVTGLHPFLPSGPQFQRAIEFFIALGFEKEWQGNGAAGLRCGPAFFILQDIDAPKWAEMQMITLEVEDLDEWFRETTAKDLPGKFAGVKLKEPAVFPWGREAHLVDTAGVFWHIRGRKKD